MVELKTNLKEVKTPDLGITCKIALTYGDKLAMQEALFSGVKVDIDDNGKKTNQGIDPSVMIKRTKVVLKSGIKEWDLTENGSPLPITEENILRLSEADGDFLYDEISKLGGEVSPEAKKK